MDTANVAGLNEESFEGNFVPKTPTSKSKKIGLTQTPPSSAKRRRIAWAKKAERNSNNINNTPNTKTSDIRGFLQIKVPEVTSGVKAQLLTPSELQRMATPKQKPTSEGSKTGGRWQFTSF